MSHSPLEDCSLSPTSHHASYPDCSKAHLDTGCDLLVALGHDVDDIGAVSLEETHIRPGDPLGKGPVGLLVLVDHSKHYQEVVLLGHAVDVAHTGVVQQLPMGVEARLAQGAVKMTLETTVRNS